MALIMSTTAETKRALCALLCASASGAPASVTNAAILDMIAGTNLARRRSPEQRERHLTFEDTQTAALQLDLADGKVHVFRRASNGHMAQERMSQTVHGEEERGKFVLPRYRAAHECLHQHVDEMVAILLKRS